VKRFQIERRQRFLTEDELARVGDVLLEVAKDGSVNAFAIAALRLLIVTGCRRNEILTARWQWIDFDRCLMNLPASKTGPKSVYLSEAALEIIRSLPKVEGNPFLIVGKSAGQRWVNLRKVWVRVRNRARLEPTILPNGKIQHVRLHDLRHSYASLLASRGASLPIIGRLLGHTNPQTTARYAHLADDPLRQFSEAAGKKISDALARLA
jgi:integrase